MRNIPENVGSTGLFTYEVHPQPCDGTCHAVQEHVGDAQPYILSTNGCT